MKVIVDPSTARPFCKMAGGKTRLLPELAARVPRSIGTYFEPFVGGGALFWALVREGRITRAVIGDTNTDLIAAYHTIYNEHLTLVRKLRRMPNDEDFYYRMRKRQPTTPLEIAARFIYLNKTCFNGLHRVNRSGQFNVPFGHYKNPRICDEANLEACSLAMRSLDHLRISVQSYEAVLRTAVKGDFLYADPPYLPNSKTYFTAYRSEGFGWADHVQLYEVVKELKKRGVRVMLSNSDHPKIRELYAKGFKVEEVKAPRAINSKGDGRGDVTELVIT